MLVGPQQMPVFSDEVMTPEIKRQVIAYLKKNEETPSYGGFAMGSLGPVSEGLFAWLLGIGGLILSAVWIGANSTRSKKKGARMSIDKHERSSAPLSRSPIRVCPSTSHGPPTSTSVPPSGPRSRSPRCSASPRSSPCSSWRPTSSFKVGEDPDVVLGLGASNVALGTFWAWPCS